MGLPELQQLARLHGSYSRVMSGVVLVCEATNTGHSIEYTMTIDSNLVTEAEAIEWLGALL